MIAGTLELQIVAGLAKLSDDMNSAKKMIGGAVGDINGILKTIGVGISFGAIF